MKTPAFLPRIAWLLPALLVPPQTRAADIPLAHAFPAPRAASVCPDTPLRLAFAEPPTLGAKGKIEIHDAADDHVVDTIDVGARIATQSIGGLANYNYYSVIVTNNEAAIFPRHGALGYGRSYYVTIEAGTFARGSEACAAIASPTAWRFTTKAAPPADTTKLTVAGDGSGDFCTVQGAIDFVPAGNTTPTTIHVRRGTYAEIVCVTDRHALTIRGEDRHATVIAYANNDKFNNQSGGNPFGGPNPDPAAAPLAGGAIYRRGVVLAHDVRDLTLANLTVRNITPQGGSQAEALILNGTATARAVLEDLDLFSYQDTLQINGQACIAHCHIEGDVDFMWGTGPCFFEHCTCRSLRSGAYYTQVRNPPTNHGYVYSQCTFDGGPGVTGNFLTRIAPARFSASEVVLLDCTLTHAVGPAAWQLQGVGDTSRLHFWEFNSRDADGKPVDVSQRHGASRQLREPTDAATIASYRDPAFVLGGGWNPRATKR